MIMVSVCLPSDALSQHLLSYLGFSYLDKVYLLTATSPDFECGIAPLGPPAPAQPPILGRGVAPLSRLTECGPLEKGMANHFSILALRTP